MFRITVIWYWHPEKSTCKRRFAKQTRCSTTIRPGQHRNFGARTYGFDKCAEAIDLSAIALLERCLNMGKIWILFSVVVLLTQQISSDDIFSEGKSDKEILDSLLQNGRYDKRLLPPVTDADLCCGLHTPEEWLNIKQDDVSDVKDRGSLTVNVSVLLLSLASPDESSLRYEVEFLLQQQWYDPRLKYGNQSRYEYLNAIHHHNDIWLPDTYFIMHGDFKDPLIPVHFSLRIYRNGSVNYLMRRHLILYCQGSLNIFPFDDPLCTFAMESISYEQTMI
ncbi:Neurotransmitter-gated ion-channel ligand binding domain [Popillia japonica]|uniref:Neurotransmitter-gated ion-channel ligand binding domain n=1 Tax=Popillia japonica TaxID=7064 RepID=A0AAW1KK74_POPJA